MLKTQLTHPDILAALARAGHGCQVAVVDSNYPATSRRHPGTPLVSLNLTSGVVDAPTVLAAIAATVPLEKVLLPLPPDEAATERAVHGDLRRAAGAAPVGTVAPQRFYELTSEVGLALMIVTGERRHFGSAIATIGYLPEL